MPNKMNTEDFILKSNKVHKGRYDYSKSIYKGSGKKIIIICPNHGEFRQIAGNHIRGNGCKKCSNQERGEKQKISQEEFIREADIIHNRKYDYSKVNYISSKDKVIIICLKHGEFKQIPANHLRGCGCQECMRGTKEEFVKRADDIHNKKYDYSKFIYIKSNKKGIIICPKHGEFLQTPSDHCDKHGCPRCKGEECSERQTLGLNVFIERANKIHNNKYDYSKVVYVNTQTKINIICPVHGEFSQNTNNHLSGYGCSKCYKLYSKKCLIWIKSFGNQNIIQSKRMTIDGRKFEFDGFDPQTNTIYEFYGDLFHGNLKVFNADDKIFYGKTFGYLYKRTMEREKFLKKAGFNIITIWENDFDKEF